MFEFIFNYLLVTYTTYIFRTVTETQSIDLELCILTEFQRKTETLKVHFCNQGAF